MATYKKACAKCGELIPGDAQFCPVCESQDPFHTRCPKCRQPIEESWKICSSCGIRLRTECVVCGKETPLAPKCAFCGAPVLVQCGNKKCNEMQILTSANRCVKCGKSLH
jgi:RNA polymerase subunit RPABC4/transcription elongation factor Spt4